MRSSTSRSSSLLLLAAVAACDAGASAGRVERCALGVHVAAPFAEREDALVSFESMIGRDVDIDRQYYRIDQDIPGAYERATADAGRTPLISVTSELTGGGMMPWARLADPDDAEAAALIDGLVGRLRDFERPILVIFHDEAQGDDLFGTPEEFIAAWRRLVDAARAAGADNAAWVFSLSSAGYPTEADDWYPGDAWVDWIGASGFNWYTGDPVSPWRPFPSIFAPMRDWAAPTGKPLIVVSVSSAENPQAAADAPRSKATWIREALGTLEDWPEVQGFVWYHGQGEDAFRDWRVDSSAAALEAFRELAAAPHLDVSGEAVMWSHVCARGCGAHPDVIATPAYVALPVSSQ